MINRLSASSRPGKMPAMNSFGMDTDWNSPNLSTASGEAFMPKAEMPKMTMGMDGGMTTPRPPEDAVIADA